MKQIRPARYDDQEAINRLRVAEYRHSDEFTLVRDTAILWDGNVAESVILAAWDGRSCVATMQAQVAQDEARAAEILGVSLAGLPGAYPALVLTRAATDRGYRRSGLNSVLRYHLLFAAEAVRSVIGVVYEGAPRCNVLCRIGYEFFPVSDAWTAALHPIRPGHLAVLNGDRVSSAVRLLAELFGGVLTVFPWHGDPLVLSAFDRT
jgi:hypothetical protein